jgi:integrase/recombinase XerD
MAKIKLVVSATIEETFSDFIISRKTKGLAEKTLQSYQSQFQAVAKHMDVKMDIAMLQKADLDAMIISMRDASLSPNSINSYTRTLKSFFSWCNEQGITRLNIPLYKAEETVKETYSDAELAALLKKPDIRKATFAEYRDWVIINFLLNCGSRAATVRAIQIRDVDLDGGMVFYRHTKNRKAQVIPLCSAMVAILREYLRHRGGETADYLFCTETGSQLTENGLRQSIARYNTRRGVQKTSIHLFRHTFARKYLIDCGGDAFTLQKLLGHSTLAMKSCVFDNFHTFFFLWEETNYAYHSGHRQEDHHCAVELHRQTGRNQ